MSVNRFEQDFDTLPAAMWKAFMTGATAGQAVLPLPGSDVSDEPEGEVETNAFDDLLAGLFEDTKDERRN